MRIKIRHHDGTRVWATAAPTPHRLLFITPARVNIIGKGGNLTKRRRFSDSEWTITHRPTGYAVAHSCDLEELKRIAARLAASKIPWEKLRSRKDAKQYSRLYRQAVSGDFL